MSYKLFKLNRSFLYNYINKPNNISNDYLAWVVYMRTYSRYNNEL